MITPDFSQVKLNIRNTGGAVTVFDPVRKKWVALTPEEHVRQYIIAWLAGVQQYPLTLMAVEKAIKLGTLTRRFDVVVYDRHHKPWMLVECKAPDVEVSQKTLVQLLHYQNVLQCRYWLLTNGHTTFCADACNAEEIRWMSMVPGYEL